MKLMYFLEICSLLDYSFRNGYTFTSTSSTDFEILCNERVANIKIPHLMETYGHLVQCYNNASGVLQSTLYDDNLFLIYTKFPYVLNRGILISTFKTLSMLGVWIPYVQEDLKISYDIFDSTLFQLLTKYTLNEAHSMLAQHYLVPRISERGDYCPYIQIHWNLYECLSEEELLEILNHLKLQCTINN